MNLGKILLMLKKTKIKFTWKYKIIVQINPSTTGGRPSTKSAGFMLTNLIRLLAKNCNAVFALLKKCGRRKIRPRSVGY